MAIVLYRESVAADQSLPTRTFQFGDQARVTLRQERVAQDPHTLTQVGTERSHTSCCCPRLHAALCIQCVCSAKRVTMGDPEGISRHPCGPPAAVCV